MSRQMFLIPKSYFETYDEWLVRESMTTKLAIQRLTLQQLITEYEKEYQRFHRLKMPTLKHKSGVRLAMLKEQVNTNQNILRERLIEKGYLSGGVPF